MDEADRLKAEGLNFFHDLKFNPSQPVPQVSKHLIVQLVPQVSQHLVVQPVPQIMEH